MYLLAALFLIIFEMVPEGLRLKKHHQVAGVIEFIYRAVVTAIVYLWLAGVTPALPHESLLKLVLGFVFVRFGLADPVHNLAAGLSINYIGFTKLWDKFWRAFFNLTRIPAETFIFIRFIFFVWGAVWLLTLNR